MGADDPSASRLLPADRTVLPPGESGPAPGDAGTRDAECLSPFVVDAASRCVCHRLPLTRGASTPRPAATAQPLFSPPKTSFPAPAFYPIMHGEKGARHGKPGLEPNPPPRRQAASAVESLRPAPSPH